MHLLTIADLAVGAMLTAGAVAAWRGKRRGPWIAAGFAAWTAVLILGALGLFAGALGLFAGIVLGGLCGTFAAGLVCVPPGRREGGRR